MRAFFVFLASFIIDIYTKQCYYKLMFGEAFMKRIVSFLFLFVFLFISCPVNHSPSHPEEPVYTLTLLKSEGSEEVYKEYYNKGDKWYYNKECTNVIQSDFVVPLPEETTISVNLEYNGGEIVNSAQAPQNNKLTSSVTSKGFYVKVENVEIDIFESNSERKLYNLSMARSVTSYAKYKYTPETFTLPELQKPPRIFLFYENEAEDYYEAGVEYPFIKDENLSAFFIHSDTCYKLTVRQDKKEDLFYYYRPAEKKWHESDDPLSSVVTAIPESEFKKVHQYTITYYANTPEGVSATVPDSKIVKGQRILNVNGIVDDNNTFIGGIYDDTLLSAQYIDYTITQDDIPSILCDSEYYEFECWVDKGPESKETVTQGSVVDGNKNYYAKWNYIEPVTFTFKDPAWFTSDENGTGVDENTRSVNAEMSVWIDQADDKCVIRRTKKTVAEGEVYGGFTLSYPSNIGTFNVIGVPSRHGYAFKGWASSAEDAIKGITKYPVSNGACLVTDKNDTSLWAVWGNDGEYWQIKISPYMPNLGSDVKPNPPDGVLYREILLPAKGYKYPGANAQLIDDTTLGTVDKDFYISEHLITGGLIEYLKQFKEYIGNIELPSIKYSSSEKGQNIYSIGSRQPEGGYNYLQPALTVNMYTAVLIANAVTARRNLFENIDYKVGLTPSYTKVSSLSSESPTWDDAVKTFAEAKELVDYCLSQGRGVYNGKGTGFRLPTDAERMFAFKAIPNLSSVWKKSEVQGNEGESIKGSLFPQFQKTDQASGDRNPASNDKDATLNAYCYTFRSSNAKSQPILDVYMKDSKLPNNIGAYHMSGLAGEWVDTPYSSTDYLVMGGSWFASGKMMRTGYRNHMTPDTNTSFIGLRLVRNK